MPRLTIEHNKYEQKLKELEGRQNEEEEERKWKELLERISANISTPKCASTACTPRKRKRSPTRMPPSLPPITAKESKLISRTDMEKVTSREAQSTPAKRTKTATTNKEIGGIEQKTAKILNTLTPAKKVKTLEGGGGTPKRKCQASLQYSSPAKK